MAEEMAYKKIEEGQALLSQLDELQSSVEHTGKLCRKIQSEIKFLQKMVKKKEQLKLEHVTCSNLGQLNALCQVAFSVPKVVAVLKGFTYGPEKQIVVDVVGDDGSTWYKVILRNPKALQQLYLNGERHGVRPLHLVAHDYIACAAENLHLFSMPKICFVFHSGVSEGLASCLQGLDIIVRGEVIPDVSLGIPDSTESTDSESFSESGSVDDEVRLTEESFLDSEQYSVESADLLESLQRNSGECTHTVSCDSSQNFTECAHSDLIRLTVRRSQKRKCSFSPLQETLSNVNPHSTVSISHVNLDVTAMIAYVSATSNGGCNCTFVDKFLTEQAEWERHKPAKKVLDGYFEGKTLMACEEAVAHFLNIVSIIGGKKEEERAVSLVSRLQIIPAVDCLKDKVPIRGNVKTLSRKIFGTGHAYQAVTITSNRGFIRAVEQQGIKLAVLFHEPRALTEKKENTATLLQKM